MLKMLARWWAKQKYVFDTEVDARTYELKALLSSKNAAEIRKTAEQLNREAEEMEANIKAFEEKEEHGYWVCENGHEKPDGPRGPQDAGDAVHCASCGKEMQLMKRSEMTGQERYESDHERKEAEKMMAQKRAQAEEAAKNVTEIEKIAQTLRGQSAQYSLLAEKIRSL